MLFVFSREFCALQKIFFETIHTTRINQERIFGRKKLGKKNAKRRRKCQNRRQQRNQTFHLICSIIPKVTFRVKKMRPFFIFTALSIFFAEGYSIQRPFLIPVSHQQTPRYTSGVPGLNGLESIRCGAFKQAASDSDVSASAQIGIISKALAAFGNAWGSLGVVYILAKAIKRVLPIALEPFMKDTALVFSSVHWRYVPLSILIYFLMIHRNSTRS